jgi:hypothetical protein
MAETMLGEKGGPEGGLTALSAIGGRDKGCVPASAG